MRTTAGPTKKRKRDFSLPLGLEVDPSGEGSFFRGSSFFNGANVFLLEAGDPPPPPSAPRGGKLPRELEGEPNLGKSPRLDAEDDGVLEGGGTDEGGLDDDDNELLAAGVVVLGAVLVVLERVCCRLLGVATGVLVKVADAESSLSGVLFLHKKKKIFR